MPKITVRRATEREARAILSRLREVKLMWRDVDLTRSRFFVAMQGAKRVGLFRLEVCGRNALLASVYVEPAYRGAGLARRLVASAETEAGRRGASRMYLFSTDAGEYFRQLGYRKVPVTATVRAVPAAPQTEWFVAHPRELAAEVTFTKPLRSRLWSPGS